MNVLLFAKNNSPCVANFSLKRAGADKIDIIHPSVVTSVDQLFYMNNFLKSKTVHQNNNYNYQNRFFNISRI